MASEPQRWPVYLYSAEITSAYHCTLLILVVLIVVKMGCKYPGKEFIYLATFPASLHQNGLYLLIEQKGGILLYFYMSLSCTLTICSPPYLLEVLTC